ncbi:MAG TPA: hypothetical protein VF723_05570 [Pyrinomonadaceae bacterium]
MSITVPGDPVLLYSNGIPIAPSDLDFGNVVTQAQLNALSSFSQMVNAIPSPGQVWVPTGTTTWDIYNLVLTAAQFAQAAQAPAPPPAQFSNTAVTVVGTGDTIQIAEPSLALKERAAELLAAHNQAAFLQLERDGFRFGGGVPAPVDPAPVLPPAPQSPGGAMTGLAALFLQLEAQLMTDTMTDTHGAAFYPTPLFPADFYQPQYDSSWQSFVITPGQDTPWAPLAQAGQVSGEMMTIPLQRAWWSTWIFSSTGWRFNPSMGMGELSDGGSPPRGLMPLYASALVIARNIEVVSGQPSQGGPQPAVSNPFTLHASAAGMTNAVTSAQLPANDLAGASDPSSMLIIGFVCVPLPKCPNPDMSLNWGN